MKKLLLLILVLLFTFSVKAQDDTTTTTYYFIRHAEKDKSDATNHNPELIRKGKRRARQWKRYFKHKPIDAIYATNYKRTFSTAFPTAINKRLPIILYAPKNTDYDAFKKETKGQSVLIVGHSNTTPRFVNAIIQQDKYKDIDETINSKLFIVTISNGQITDQVIDLK
ncbi:MULTISPECIES: histidine phosphatase family protein [unclassified Olleya]|uniref:histidine phosphatase family protein n=1 Tax=unclassified Olleya TaxID=2615019 RepID=UPI000C30CAFE|nr:MULTISPECIES: histidine phosphatase family protein [unclassified Olleya]AUC76083.1 phosphoglycerate mutase [Olleya sp. Bg11-27]QXP58278.1 histidine phosphatase family protein [Olleya sp. HaHaR_3_96]